MFKRSFSPLRASILFFLVLILVASCSIPGQRTRANSFSNGTRTADPRTPTKTIKPFLTSTMTPTATATPTLIPTPGSEQEGNQKIILGNQLFSWNLLQKSSGAEKNAVFSSFSQLESLILISSGAAGETLAEINNAMQIFLPVPSLLDFNQKLVEKFFFPTAEGEPSGPKDQFLMVNSLWLQSGYQFLPDFINTVVKKFHAGVQLADFAGSTETARNDINQSISDQTMDKIQNLVPEGVLTSRTRMLATNAIYFSSPWKQPFDYNETTDRPFKNLDGSLVNASTMHMLRSLPYAKHGNLEAVELPFNGGKRSMVFILPASGKFTSIQNEMKGEEFSEILSILTPRSISLSLPKFSFETVSNNAEVLKLMGMQKAFTDEADFRGMDGTRSLYLQALVQKAKIDVNEAGTMAAAATTAVFGIKSLPSPQTLDIRFDRPFFFVIRDLETGAILFIGRVTDPTRK